MLEALSCMPATVEQLGRQVRDLEELGAALDSIDEEWRSRSHEEWSALEEAYAVSLAVESNAVTGVTGERAALVAGALGRLRASRA